MLYEEPLCASFIDCHFVNPKIVAIIATSWHLYNLWVFVIVLLDEGMAWLKGWRRAEGGKGMVLPGHLMRRFLCRRAYVDYDVCSLWVSTWSARTSLYNKSLETVRGVREINVKHFSLSSVRSMKIDVHFDIWAERQRDRRESAS